MKFTREQLRHAYRAAKDAVLPEEILARELGLEIAESLPDRIIATDDTGSGPMLFPGPDVGWPSREARLAGYVEAARRYGAVTEAIEYINSRRPGWDAVGNFVSLVRILRGHE